MLYTSRIFSTKTSCRLQLVVSVKPIALVISRLSIALPEL